MTTLLRRLPAATRVSGPESAAPRRICRRCVATRSRTYDDALQLLDTLQANAAVKSIFAASHPSSPATHTHSHDAHHSVPSHAHAAAAPPSPSLNARAIPEMLAWLSHAGLNPSTLPLRALHVAGTKGKGSTASYAASVLRAGLRGARVGTYASPHLVTVRERISLDGHPIPRDLFARYFFEVWDAVGCAAASDPGGGSACADGLVRPFYFRFLTILALHAFVREGIRDVVLECGIGGEHDATNVLPAHAVSATVVTRLELDHVAMLGGTREEIAWHKAGIFRRGVPAFTRPQGSASVMDVLRSRAAERGAELVVVSNGEAARWAGDGAGGPFEGDNRALAAAAALYHIRGAHGAVSTADERWMRRAMSGARLRGRCEVLRRGAATFFLDGAHTPGSVAQIGAWFGRRSAGAARRVLVFNQQERDASALLESLVRAFAPGVFDEAIFTRNEVEEGGDVIVQQALAETMARISPETRVYVEGGLKEALGRIGEADVLVTGSMYLVGGVLRVLEQGG